MANSIDIKIPDLGDFSDVDVIEVLVKAGDTVAPEDGLITLETDKAAMDVPATDAGEIEEITVAVGDKVSTGDVIGRMKIGKGSEDTTTGDGEKAAAGTDAGRSEEEEDTNILPQQSENEDTNILPQPSEKQEEAAETKDDGGSKREPESEEAAGAEGDRKQQTVAVPDLGDFSDVDVIEVHVSEGDAVKLEDPLITLETDKAAMDVPSTAAGRIESVLVKVGDKVSEGSKIAVIAASAPADKKRPEATARKEPQEKAAAKAEPKKPAEEPQTAGQARSSMPAIDEAGFSKAHASPSVRKLARELGVDLARVKGSGEKKRILHEDVKNFVKELLTGGAIGGALPKVPSVDFAKFGEVDVEPLTRIQKIAGPRLQASWINLPHVTQHDLADITELEAKRQELKGPAKERGISLTILAFIMRACVATLKEFPKANASLAEDGQNLVYKQYFHLGFAADTENGLMVPVIRNADQKDVYEIATELGQLSKAARAGKLKADQMQGASFTISSLGGIGGTAFTPIVNAPEVAILGVSRSTMQPVWDGKEFKPRLMLPLSLSYDHRVIDGAYAVRFTTFLCETFTDVDALLEAIP